MKKTVGGLYFITDRALSRQGILEDARQVLEAGCRLVQYREKAKKTGQMVEEAKQLAELCKASKALFLVNDRIDVALAADADGVHLGQSDMPVPIARKLLGKEKVIGTSNHSLQDAEKSIAEGADYISIGPVFHTDTKKDAGKPVGLSLLKEVKAAANLPIVAIGGINEENLEQVLKAGADSVAIISAIVCAESPGRTAKSIIEKIGEFK